MKTKLITALTLATVAGAFSVATIAQTVNATKKNWLPINQIIEKVEAQGYSNIIEIERDDGQYEVKASNSEGVMTKLYLDRETGEILKTRNRSDKGDRRKKGCDN